MHLFGNLLAIRILKMVGDHLSAHFEETEEKAEWLPDLASRLQKLANDANPIISKKAFEVGMLLSLPIWLYYDISLTSPFFSFYRSQISILIVASKPINI